MKISAVIPVINEVERIVDCVHSAWDAGCDELIVVDGGSTDGTLDLLETLDCRITHSELGRGRQLNAGAQLASGTCLLFLHADCKLRSGACQQIRELECGDDAGEFLWGGFHQLITHSNFKYRLIEKGNLLRAKMQGLVYGDQGMFVTRQSFQQAGQFPDYALMEDFEISRKLLKLAPPRLLPGPIRVDPRRWEKNGVARQTIQNWGLALAYRMGISPNKLARIYQNQ